MAASVNTEKTRLSARNIAPIWDTPCLETHQHILIKKTIVDIYNCIPQLPEYRPLQQRLRDILKNLWYSSPQSEPEAFAGLWGNIYCSLITLVPFIKEKNPQWIVEISVIWNKSQAERRKLSPSPISPKTI